MPNDDALKQPMAEVFGFPIHDLSDEAKRYRKKRLCPFNNRVPNCTKDKAKNPLGVCSVFQGKEVVITCPVRFRQEWIIADDAAEFFFPEGATWTTLTEVRLDDRDGKSAGNIDVVLAAYNEAGKIYDFGALEVQAVYISGNIRNPFESYMKDPERHADLDWRREENYPRPDYLSSSRKRLAPQLIFKGGILHCWGKKTAVALNRGFFLTLPKLEEVDKAHAEVAWMIYDVVETATDTRGSRQRQLVKHKIVYTKFDAALDQITKPRPGRVEDFIEHLQVKVDEKLETPPNTENLTSLK